MSDGRRPSEREIERGLRDLGARIEYPPTPDVAPSVRRRLDEDGGRRSPGRGLWQSLLSPGWAVTAAALVLIAFALLSPAVRETLSVQFFPGQAASSGAGGGAEAGRAAAGDSAARPESGGAGGRSGQEADVVPQAGGSRAQDAPSEGAPGSAAAGSASAAAGAAVGCPSPYLEPEPARAAPGGSFRLRGHNFSSSCERIAPAQGIRIDFRQGGKRWKLATVESDRNLTFDTRLRVPADATPGRATVSATTRSGELVEERFVVLG